jgi:hypothetical protein
MFCNSHSPKINSEPNRSSRSLTPGEQDSPAARFLSSMAKTQRDAIRLLADLTEKNDAARA